MTITTTSSLSFLHLISRRRQQLQQQGRVQQLLVVGAYKSTLSTTTTTVLVAGSTSVSLLDSITTTGSTSNQINNNNNINNSIALRTLTTSKSKRLLTVDDHGIDSNAASKPITGATVSTGATVATVGNVGTTSGLGRTTGSSSSSSTSLGSASSAAGTSSTDTQNGYIYSIVGSVAITGAAYYYYTNIMKSKPDTIKESIEKKPVPVVATVTKKEVVPVLVPVQVEKNTIKDVIPMETKQVSTTGTGTSSIPMTMTTTPTGTTPTPGRVTTIAIPDKMKNTATTTTTTTGTTAASIHPEDGNRVTTLFGNVVKEETKENDNEDTDWSVTNKSIKVLQQTIQDESIKELMSSYHTNATLLQGNSTGTSSNTNGTYNVNDIDTLSITQLKLRIFQLITELNDRTKWEAVRLKEFLILKETETTQKYVEILQKQKLEYEDMVAKKLREQQTIVYNEMNKLLQNKDETIQNVINNALQVQKVEYENEKLQYEQLIQQQYNNQYENEYYNKLNEYKSIITNDLQTKTNTILSLQKQLQQLQQSLHILQVTQDGSFRAHKLSAAALALADVLETNTPAIQELNTLKKVAGKEGVISTAVLTIPEDACAVGIPTISQLQSRFNKSIYTNCRQATLVPSGRYGLDGQIAGILFSFLKYPPTVVTVSTTLSSPMTPTGSTTSTLSDSTTGSTATVTSMNNNNNNYYNNKEPEYLLEQIKLYINDGELELAINTIDLLPINHQSIVLLKDWKNDALNRICIDKALKVIKMECALLNESCL